MLFFSGLTGKRCLQKKRMRVHSQEKRRWIFSLCQYQDSENETKTMVAFIRKEDLPRGVLILVTGTDDKTLIEPDGYAICELGDLYGFVSCVNNVLVNDVVGNKKSDRECSDNIFFEFNETPEPGWKLYQPESWISAGHSPHSLCLRWLT